MKRLSLSLSDELFEETDKFAKQLRQSRSGFVQSVLAEYLKERRGRALSRRLAQEYQEMAGESLTQSRAYAGIEEEALDQQADGAGDGLDW